jgi:hypothetical protein
MGGDRGQRRESGHQQAAFEPDHDIPPPLFSR